MTKHLKRLPLVLVIMLIETALVKNILAIAVQDRVSLKSAAGGSGNKDGIDPNNKYFHNSLYVEGEESTNSLRGVGRFLAQTPRSVWTTCDKYPKVCRAKGSPGPNCCKKSCVNLQTDRFNCGVCGKRCKYSEMCCKGRCVNIWTDKKHCGGCDNKCKKGKRCVYGMCGYA